MIKLVHDKILIRNVNSSHYYSIQKLNSTMCVISTQLPQQNTVTYQHKLVRFKPQSYQQLQLQMTPLSIFKFNGQDRMQQHAIKCIQQTYNQLSTSTRNRTNYEPYFGFRISYSIRVMLHVKHRN